MSVIHEFQPQCGFLMVSIHFHLQIHAYRFAKKTIHGLFFLPNISGPPSLVVLLGLRLAPAQRLHCTSVRRMGRGGAFLARAQRAEVQQSQPAIGVA